MVGLQQTLPLDLKLSLFAITSTKSYTLQGWTGGFNLLSTSLSKSLLKDKLNLSVSGSLGLNKNGNINIDSESRGKFSTREINIRGTICRSFFAPFLSNCTSTVSGSRIFIRLT